MALTDVQGAGSQRAPSQDDGETCADRIKRYLSQHTCRCAGRCGSACGAGGPWCPRDRAATRASLRSAPPGWLSRWPTCALRRLHGRTRNTTKRELPVLTRAMSRSERHRVNTTASCDCAPTGLTPRRSQQHARAVHVHAVRCRGHIFGYFGDQNSHRCGSDASAMWMYRWMAMGWAGFRASARSISASAFTAHGRGLPS